MRVGGGGRMVVGAWWWVMEEMVVEGGEGGGLVWGEVCGAGWVWRRTEGGGGGEVVEGRGCFGWVSASLTDPARYRLACRTV